MTRGVLAGIVASLIGTSGCARVASRPPCGPAQSPVLPPVSMVAACMLPPGPRLYPVTLTPCPPEWTTGGVCIDTAQAAALAARLDSLQSWIRQAKAACPQPARVDAGPVRDS